jgi:hypothetical protein
VEKAVESRDELWKTAAGGYRRGFDSADGGCNTTRLRSGFNANAMRL